jgi:hypothetical protein
MRKAKRRMVEAVRKKGGDSIVWGIGWECTMLDDPNFILRGSDDAEIHALKIDFINKWKEIRQRSRFTLIWAASGCAITVIIMMLEAML